jgi:hypothetical protein
MKTVCHLGMGMGVMKMDGGKGGSSRLQSLKFTAILENLLALSSNMTLADIAVLGPALDLGLRLFRVSSLSSHRPLSHQRFRKLSYLGSICTDGINLHCNVSDVGVNLAMTLNWKCTPEQRVNATYKQSPQLL